eukprot:TRINITY_DN9701_c0_g1_i4.p1 TRINITY_DN9701_c0_g1~~TRINITY_DN9701_c0_g1_i4.p1  ORF type:complete len:152 (-),score=13.08 TRINITY_DN9701_c0_g1_i4:70-525(-)
MAVALATAQPAQTVDAVISQVLTKLTICTHTVFSYGSGEVATTAARPAILDDPVDLRTVLIVHALLRLSDDLLILQMASYQILSSLMWHQLRAAHFLRSRTCQKIPSIPVQVYLQLLNTDAKKLNPNPSASIPLLIFTQKTRNVRTAWTKR